MLVLLSVVLTASVLFPNITGGTIVAIIFIGAGACLLGCIAYAQHRPRLPSRPRPGRQPLRAPRMENAAADPPRSTETLHRAKGRAHGPACVSPDRDDPGHRPRGPARSWRLNPRGVDSTTGPSSPLPSKGSTDEHQRRLQRTALHAFNPPAPPVLDSKGNQFGVLADVIVRLRDRAYPTLSGLVVSVGNTRIFTTVEDVAGIDADGVRLRTTKLDLRPFSRREGEVLLKEDVLGHRLIDTDRTIMVKAYDIELAQTGDSWEATGLDVHKPRWFRTERSHKPHAPRDWNQFLPLIGHKDSSKVRSDSPRFRKMKPAQIADLIEDSSDKEQHELLAQVHNDPELEADVFEELDEDRPVAHPEGPQ